MVSFNITNFQVLLISPKFFGYEYEIKKGLEQLGATVEWIQDRPYDSAFFLTILRLFPKVMLHFVAKHQIRKLQKLKGKVDIVFAVNPVTLTPVVMENIKILYPKARYILYLWDSINNRLHMKMILSFFQEKWCFDPETSKEYEMELRPLFYINVFKSSVRLKMKYNICFVGTAHSDRYDVLIKVLNNNQKIYDNIVVLYLKAKWLFWFYKIFKPAMWEATIEEFSFKPIASREVARYFHQSRVILDIEHPKQTGLTIRTLESIGSRTKLITTNRDVVNYDFYSKNNIAIIDRFNPVIDINFFKQEYEPLPESIYHKYSISGWLEEILI
jgi:hypothetical protein